MLRLARREGKYLRSARRSLLKPPNEMLLAASQPRIDSRVIIEKSADFFRQTLIVNKKHADCGTLQRVRNHVRRNQSGEFAAGEEIHPRAACQRLQSGQKADKVAERTGKNRATSRANRFRTVLIGCFH